MGEYGWPEKTQSGASQNGYKCSRVSSILATGITSTGTILGIFRLFSPDFVNPLKSQNINTIAAEGES